MIIIIPFGICLLDDPVGTILTVVVIIFLVSVGTRVTISSDTALLDSNSFLKTVYNVN